MLEAGPLVHALQQRQDLPRRLLQRLHHLPDLLRAQRAVSRATAPAPPRPIPGPARPGTSRMSWSWPSAPCSAANISLTDMVPPLPAHGAFRAAGARLSLTACGAAPGCPRTA